MVVDGTVINRLTGIKGYSLCLGLNQKERRIRYLRQDRLVHVKWNSKT